MNSHPTNINMNPNINGITKVLAVLYIVLCEVIIPAGYANGIVRIGVLSVLFLCVLFTENWKVQLDAFYKVELVFIVVTAATSIIVSKDFSLSVEPIESLIYEFVFGYCMLRICIKDRSINIFAIAMVISGVLLSVILLTTGGVVSGKIARISINETMNENTLGVFLMLCIWCTIYLFTKHEIKLYRIVFAVINIAILLYYIIGTASRKALISAIFLLFFSVLFIIRPYLKKYSLGKRAIILSVLLIAIGFIVYRYGNLFNTISYSMNNRMQRLSNERITDMHRFDLVKDATRVFLNNPILGIGWNNYRLYSFSSQYSHCTYVEILACTGVVGSIFGIYLWGKVLCGVKNLRSNSIDLLNSISLIIVFVFICSVQIMYYNTTLLMIFHIIYTYSSISKYE